MHCFQFFSSVQSLSRVRLLATPWTAACQPSLSITNSWSLLRLMYIKSVMPSNHLILCYTLLSCLQSFPASGSFQMSQFFTSGIGDVYLLHQSILHQRYTFFTKVLEIINKVAINMHVQIFLCVNINFYSQTWNCWAIWQVYV